MTKYCRVTFEYDADGSDEHSLVVGDILEITGEAEDGWYDGLLKGKTGSFPSNFVELISEEEADKEKLKRRKSSARRAVPVRPSAEPNKNKDDGLRRAKVTFEYSATASDELDLVVGSIIEIVSMENPGDGWWEGQINGKSGVFPDNFVELLPVEAASKKAESTYSVSAKTLLSNPAAEFLKKQQAGTAPGRPARPVKDAVRPPAKTPSPATNSLPSRPISKPESISQKKADDTPQVDAKSKLKSREMPARPPPQREVPSWMNKLKRAAAPASTSSGQASSKSAASSGPSSGKDNTSEIPSTIDLPSSSAPLPSETEEAKPLVHLTANRAKRPNNRRPPGRFAKKIVQAEAAREGGEERGGASVESASTSRRKAAETKPVTPGLSKFSASKNVSPALSKGSSTAAEEIRKEIAALSSKAEQMESLFKQLIEKLESTLDEHKVARSLMQVELDRLMKRAVRNEKREIQ